MDALLINALVGLAGASLTAIAFLGRRHFTRGDAASDQRVEAYRGVVTSIATLRSAGNQLRMVHDWNQEPSAEQFAPTNRAMEEAYNLIEQNRADVGHLFSDAAKCIVKYWDDATSLMWNGDYMGGVDDPSLADRETAMYAAIPSAYQTRVAPGHFEEVAKAAKAKRKPTVKSVTANAQGLNTQVKNVLAEVQQMNAETKKFRDGAKSLPSGENPEPHSAAVKDRLR